MNFFHHEFLWAFTILIIPIIIHLFNFKRYKTLYFSSLSFIKHVDEQTKATKKLKYLLTLISRLLAFSFLILAFAQPYFADDNKNLKFKNSIIAFYIDNSFSMQAVGSNGELLSEAREIAREIINKSSLDTKFLISTNAKNGSEERLLSKIQAIEKIDEIKLSPLTRSINEIIEWQNEKINSNKLIGDETSIQRLLISDFQSNTRFDSNSIPVKIKSNNSFSPIKLSPKNFENIFIDSIWFSSPIKKLGKKNELNIKINNPSKKDLKNVELNIEIENYQNTIFIDLPKNEKTTTIIGYTDESIGIKSGEIRLYDNNINFDDKYFFNYNVRENLNILLINGEDATNNIENVLNLDPFYITNTTTTTTITREDFTKKDLVIINGANKLSKGIINYISDFSLAGGTVSLFPGKSPNQTDWNELLLSLRLPTIGKKINSGNNIKNLNFKDPFFTGIFKENNSNLNLPNINISFQSIKNSRTLCKNLITLKNGLPLFVFNENKSKSFMFYSSLDIEFGKFTKDALFTSIILRTAELSQRNQPEYIIIGKSNNYPIYSEIKKEKPLHIIGNKIDFIPQIETTSGVKYISVLNSSKSKEIYAGNYSIIEEKKKIGEISLNYDRKESLINSFTKEQIKTNLNNIGIKKINFNKIDENLVETIMNIDKPYQYWKFCIVLTIIFVLLEMVFIRYLK
ncbi:MAG: hypothetical protein CL844_02165 [Crocinitomicaceae bacterium]|nr:hypothetical protein [Crocinitomicaceae bacterium]